MKTIFRRKIFTVRIMLTLCCLCVTASYVYTQELMWSNSVDYDYIIRGRVGVDNDNNVYSLFYSFSDYSLNKYDENGSLLWNRSDTGWMSIGDMFVDKQGVTYLAGTREVANNVLDCYCVAFNAQGFTQYEGYYTISNISQEAPVEIKVDENGYAYIFGFALIDTVYHVFTLKMNPGGTVSWAQTHNFDNEHVVQAAWLVLDDFGNVYVSGVHAAGPDSVSNFIIKYANNGQHIYTKKYLKQGNTMTIAYRLIPDQDQNLIFVGAVGASNVTRGYIAKLDHNGEVIWDHTFNPSSNEMALYSADLDETGNIYVSGIIVVNNNHEGYYAKIAPDGVVLWENLYMGPANSYDGIYEVIVEGDACYWAGQTMGITTKSDILLFKTDTAGNMDWEIFYDGAAHNVDQYEDFLLCPDHNIVISAITEELYQDNFGTTIKFTNPIFIIENRDPTVELSVFPNPAEDFIHLSGNIKGRYFISDMSGTMAGSGILNKNAIDVSTLSPGVYLFHILDEDMTYYAKFVKQ